MQTLEQLENTAAINPDIQTVDLEKPLLMGNLEIPSLEIRKPNVQALQGVKIADLLQGDVISICTVGFPCNFNFATCFKNSSENIGIS